jgi:hypothetical protein
VASKKTTQGTKVTKSTRNTKGTRNTMRAGGTQSGKYLSGYDWGRILAKAWSDPDFKRRIEADPTTTIRQFLSGLPNGNTYEGINIFNIPPKPSELNDDQLDDIVNGDDQMYHCSHLC